MINQGFPNKRIAGTLEFSPETVKLYAKRIFAKLAVSIAPRRYLEPDALSCGEARARRSFMFAALTDHTA